jgi:hypothetical protein
LEGEREEENIEKGKRIDKCSGQEFSQSWLSKRLVDWKLFMIYHTDCYQKVCPSANVIYHRFPAEKYAIEFLIQSGGTVCMVSYMSAKIENPYLQVFS